MTSYAKSQLVLSQLLKCTWTNQPDGRIEFSQAGLNFDLGGSNWFLIDILTTTDLFDGSANGAIGIWDGTGLFRFLLEADDALAHEEDTVGIYVTETACDAAMIDPDDHYQSYEFVGDTNDDCEVNIEDLAIMAATWQDCLTDKLGCIP